MVVYAKRSALVGGYLFEKEKTVEVSDSFAAEVAKNPFLEIKKAPKPAKPEKQKDVKKD